MSNVVGMGYEVLDRMVCAVDLVRERLLRSTKALEEAGIPYAVIGGNAVATWVSKVDLDAVRNTVDVDIMLRDDDLDAAKSVLEKAGFVYRHSAGIDFFLDGPDGKFRTAVHILKAGQKVREEYILPAPTLDESQLDDQFRVVSLEALVRMKLTSFRDKDRTHLRDFLELGMVDATWKDRFPELLSDRLQQLLDTPNG